MDSRICLNLGCGAFRIDGTLGVDRVQRGNTDVVADLASTLPVKSGSADTVYAYHIFEHLDFVRLMDEIHRVLADGGILRIRVPHASSFNFWDDPTHIRPFTSRTFDYWEPGYHQEYGFRAHFRVLNRRLRFLGNPEVNRFRILPGLTNSISRLIDFFANAHIRLCERLWAHWVGGFGEIEFELKKA